MTRFRTGRGSTKIVRLELDLLVVIGAPFNRGVGEVVGFKFDLTIVLRVRFLFHRHLQRLDFGVP